MDGKTLLVAGLMTLAGTGYAQRDPVLNAENLWNEPVPLDSLIRNTTLTIVPFSTSNCGYCLIDGYFTEENYLLANEENGGTALHLCLFNPQLDITAFQKHFRWQTPVIDWPVGLNRYHEDGFPTLLAFRGGKQVLKEFYNYADFDTLKGLLWSPAVKMHPTGQLHLATRFIYENEKMAAVMVVPPGKPIPEEDRSLGKKWKAYRVIPLDSLTPADLDMHLFLKGDFPCDELQSFFGKNDLPVKFRNGSVLLGDYQFPFDSVGIQACFPSPFNPEKFIVLNIGHHQKLDQPVNYLDFVIYSGSDTSKTMKWCYGHFVKTDPMHWTVDDEHTFSDRSLHAYCETQCPVPRDQGFPVTLSDPAIVPVSHRETPFGTLFMFGNAGCRFPSVCCDSAPGCWVSWEEAGNILLGHIQGDEVASRVIEGTSSDSYNPVIAAGGGQVWVAWLGDRDGYYRVYARALEGTELSEPVLLSEKEPFDAITLAGATDGNGITFAWSEWKANQRFLKMEQIARGIPMGSRSIHTAPPRYLEEYTNAWAPSLCYTGKGILQGAWNQHYPGTFCIISGNLTDEPVPVTASGKDVDDWEVGGYPDLFADASGNLFTVWESTAWDAYWDHTPQQIRYSARDAGSGRWSPAKTLPEAGTLLNQSPSGVFDREGRLIVVWSGREEGSSSTWGIWMSVRGKMGWSKPERISPEGSHARAPRVALNPSDGVIWITWHAGTGDSMKVECLELNPLQHP